MAKTDITKATSKLSKQLTKDFEKLVKAFVRDIGRNTESARAKAAYVIGYLDSYTGNVTPTSSIPDGHFSDYSRGWDDAGGRTYVFKNGRMTRKKP
jgi:hypothetical protein